LNGPAAIMLEAAVDSYTEQGAVADDLVDGISLVVIGGDTVDVNTPGVYVVTYDKTDTATNSAIQVTRTVTVQDMTPPVITLFGSNPLNYEGGNPYIDAGAYAFDLVDGDRTANITPTSDVNPNVVGMYTVDYDVTDVTGNSAIQVTRTVIVQDTTPPVTTIDSALDGNSILITNGATTNSNSIDIEFSATDNISQPINLTFECNLDSAGYQACTSPYSLTSLSNAPHTVEIRATDEEGNVESTVSLAWTINVMDTTAPVINILGENPKTQEINVLYTDLGAYALDDNDGDVTANIVTTNNVIENVIGVYTVDYQVTDMAGNTAMDSRTVNVVDVTPPSKISSPLLPVRTSSCAVAPLSV